MRSTKEINLHIKELGNLDKIKLRWKWDGRTTCIIRNKGLNKLGLNYT